MVQRGRPDSKTDPLHPPSIPTEVRCLHCGHEYESYLIEWHEKLVHGRIEGFWCCPTPGCDGKGFGFDILPIDPEYIDADGRDFGIFLDDSDAQDIEQMLDALIDEPWDDDLEDLDEELDASEDDEFDDDRAW